MKSYSNIPSPETIIYDCQSSDQQFAGRVAKVGSLKNCLMFRKHEFKYYVNNQELVIVAAVLLLIDYNYIVLVKDNFPSG